MHLSLFVQPSIIYLALEWEYKYLSTYFNIYLFLETLQTEVLYTLHYSSVYPYCLQRYRQLKQQWEMKSEEAELLQSKLHQSAYHKQEEELLALKKTIGDKCVLNLLTES